jgi:4-hydroxy-tetrahydrodipicolinate reductase
MKVAVIGTGKTGSAVVNMLGDEAIPYSLNNKPTVDSLSSSKADIAIVFVSPAAAGEIVELLLEAKIPAVWGTTGYQWPADLPGRVKAAGTRWVIGSNFSLGMNLIRKTIGILGKGAELLKSPEFHIHEVHHTDKIDAPSGTALSWKEWLGQEPSISSDRQGDVKGIHSLHIKTVNESIWLKHEAHSRELFAEGAIWTAKYLLKHPHIDSGVYPFSSIFDRAFKEKL